MSTPKPVKCTDGKIQSCGMSTERCSPKTKTVPKLYNRGIQG